MGLQSPQHREGGSDVSKPYEAPDRRPIMRRAATGEVLVLDERPEDEWAVAHLPHARSLPVDELKKRIAELSKDVPVVAYCRGPFCLMAKAAVELLRKKGYQAFHLTDGVAEWRARGLPVKLLTLVSNDPLVLRCNKIQVAAVLANSQWRRRPSRSSLMLRHVR